MTFPLMPFKYREKVLNELARHGVAPNDDTPPELIRDFVNDLYVYEIRALKARLKAGRFPKSEYAARVEQLRRRYPILSLPLVHWVEEQDLL
ncbi:MAG TPA: hypothetical protein VJZ91_07380 [Blastocatellia bacterium]|nr:hypothetical protein [Blastocatellia bacterium]